MVGEILSQSSEYGFDWDEHRKANGGSADGNAAHKVPRVNWNVLKTKRDAYVARLNGIYANNLDKDQVTRIDDHGSFVGPRIVAVGDRRLTAPHIVIATGGQPKMNWPDVFGMEHAISSDGFFDLEKQPRKAAVVGAGYIAVELAGVFNGLGTETHLFFRYDRALRNFDHLLADTLYEEMNKAGLHQHAHMAVKGITKESDGSLTLHYTQKKDAADPNPEEKKLTGLDCVLMAVGREPKLATLGLEHAAVNAKPKEKGGHILVDAFQNTSAPGVYALGDVCGHVELTPVAIAAGRALAERLFNNKPHSKLDYTAVPTVVFSHPPIGTCGLTERDAVAKYGRDAVTIYQSRFTNMFFAMMPMEHKQATAMKLVCVGDEEKVVGVHLIGMGADEMLQGFGGMIKMGATKQQWDSVVAIHPTASEELVTMRNGKKSSL